MKRSAGTPRTAPPKPDPAPSRLLPWLLLALAVSLFVWHASASAFLQDDSYITYRYARNVARGHGPVFNPGERVEGYTNFLWMVLLASLAVAGLPFTVIIPLSQVIGVVCGAGIIFIFFLLLRRHSRAPPLVSALAVLLLSANGAFACWCVSGMETPLFTLFLVAAAWFWLQAVSDPGRNAARSTLAAALLLGLSALTRPEGVMFFGLFVLHFLLVNRGTDRGPLTRVGLGRLGLLVLPFLALVLPLYVWRISYYGQFFPNTYYAKTGTSVEYLKAGVEYVWSFLRAYGLWGLAAVGPVALAAWKKRLRPTDPIFFCLLLLGVYVLYVIRVGGDVLHNWRFFVPVLFLFYFLLAEGIWLLPLPRLLKTALLLGLVPLTFYGPFTRPRTVRREILRNIERENDLVSKMTKVGLWFNANLAPDEWLAATTIGAVSFYSDRNLIDMLGLTDPVIAREPERILTAEWYWRERNYNTRHVLSRSPAFIYFSTGIKPSAEAERALFLRPRFRRGYYACPITLPGVEDGRVRHYDETVFAARPGNDTIPLDPVAEPSTFINRYLDGINFLVAGADTAEILFRQCIAGAPGDFGAPWEWLGHFELERDRRESAALNYEEALRRSDWLVASHASLSGIRFQSEDFAAAAAHLRKVVSYAPDYYDGYADLAVSLLRLEAWDEAEQTMLEACRRFPLLSDAEYRLAWVRIEAGRLDAAEAQLTALLTRSPNDPNALSLMQMLHRRRAPSLQ